MTEKRLIPGERTASLEGSSAAGPSGAAERLTKLPHFCLISKKPGHDDCTLVECAYGPALHVLEKAGFSFREFPRVRAYYMDAIRSRLAWQKTPKLPGL